MHHQYLGLDTIDCISKVTNATHYQQALALAIAYALPMPSLPVESPLSYFGDNFKQVAEAVAGVFTEVRPTPIAETVENAKAIWNARYAIAHGAVISQIAAGSGSSPSVLSIFGISYNVPAALLASITDNAATIEPVFAKMLSAMIRTNMVTGVQTAI